MNALRPGWLVLSICLQLLPAAVRAEEFVLLKNAGNATPALGRSDVRELFTGKRKQWASGETVQVVLGPDSSPALKWLAAVVFNVDVPVLISKIKQEVFRGEMRKPIRTESDDEVIQKVKSAPGALGVVGAESAKTLPAGVALVSVGN